MAEQPVATVEEHPRVGGKRLPASFYAQHAAPISDSESDYESSSSGSSSSSEDEIVEPIEKIASVSASSPPNAKKAKISDDVPAAIVAIARDTLQKANKLPSAAPLTTTTTRHSSNHKERKKRRMLAIVDFYNAYSTKLRACGKCKGCKAPPCGECAVCKRNAGLASDAYKKSKRRCTALQCDVYTAEDIQRNNQNVILRDELYHIRPDLTNLEERRMKWANIAVKYAGTQKGEDAVRMRNVKFRQIVVLLKEFKPELEKASDMSAKMIHTFLDKKKAKYVKKHRRLSRRKKTKTTAAAATCNSTTI